MLALFFLGRPFQWAFTGFPIAFYYHFCLFFFISWRKHGYSWYVGFIIGSQVFPSWKEEQSWNNIYWNRTIYSFHFQYRIFCSVQTEFLSVCHYLPQPQRPSRAQLNGWSPLFLCPAPSCPDGGWRRWLMLSPHLWILREGQCLQHSAAGNWTKETCFRVESPCPITEDSSDPFIFLSFCGTFRKSFAYAVYSFWAILSFLGGKQRICF